MLQAPTRRLPAALALQIAVALWSSAAAAEPIAERDAIARALRHNPILKSALLDYRRSAHVVDGEQARHGFTLRSSVGATRAESPVSLTNGGVDANRSDILDASVSVDKRFPWGTSVALSASGSRITRQLNITRMAGGGTDFGPDYGLETRLSVSQPLIRGGGLDVGESQLRIARIDLSAASHARDRTASELLRDVLRSYWELWYSSVALEVQQAARKLARTQYEQAQALVENGTLAAVETLSFATRIATLDESVMQARADQRRRSLELGRILGDDAAGRVDLEASAEPTTPPAFDQDDAAIRESALRASYELRELQSSVEAARERAGVAADALKPRLDLDAYVALSGLGENEFGEPFEQIGKGEAISAHIGATFELPFDSTQRRSQEASARLNAESLQARLDARRHQLMADVTILEDRLNTARERVKLGEQTVEIARKLAEAETGRFNIGTGTPLQVIAAQKELRDAELRMLRARVDGATAHISLAHGIGALLPNYRVADNMLQK